MRKDCFRSCVLFMFLCIACFGNVYAGKPLDVVYELNCSARPDRYYQDVKNALVVTAGSDVNNNQIYDPSQLPKKTQKAIAKKMNMIFTPDTEEFINESIKSFVRSSGIRIGYDKTADFNLRVCLKELKVADGLGSAPCTAVLEWSLLNPDRQMVLDGTARGRYTMTPGQSMVEALDKAYSKAIKEIDWAAIATLLGAGRSDRNDSEQVTGEGSTTLEHTVIRWYVISSPAGADVSWRVVSSTPDVRNTNSNFMGTTPYESTESFDIKGLTPDNAGNVQIEITCEKNGYLLQRKRFNLRQAIDQREISAKFNLVKESEE